MIKNYGTWLKESAAPAMSLTGDEIEDLDFPLWEEILEHIWEEILNWEPAAERSREAGEAEALRSYGAFAPFLIFWKIYSDATLEVVLHQGDNSLHPPLGYASPEKREELGYGDEFSDKFEHYDLGWQDSEGRTQHTNFLSALQGKVKVDFEKNSTSGENALPPDLAKRVKQFFQKKRGHLTGKKFGL